MSLYSDAATGVLTSTTLADYLKTHDVNEPSTEKGNKTFGLTPLALAAQNGHVEVARLLLTKGAEVDAFSSQRRTPLWIVTARGKSNNRAEVVNLLLEHRANPLYSDPALHDGATPLLNELQQLKDPNVIRVLVKYHGKTGAAEEFAAKLGRPEVNEAMNSIQKNFLQSIVSLIVTLVFLIIGWANNLINGARAIFNQYQISGDQESEMAKAIKEEIPEPKTQEELQQGVSDFVDKHKLGKFFKEDSKDLLEKITAKAVELQKDDSTVLGRPENADNLVKLALYQPVIYCDDSGSMNTRDNAQGEDRGEDRMTDQRNLVNRIASICTKIVPDELGVHLRFINSEPRNADGLRMDGIQRIMDKVKPSGRTAIGTRLRERILQPLLYSQYNDTVKNMKRPLFISIITDGVPNGGDRSPETVNTLKNEIELCQDYLREKSLPSRAVVFQISQIGSDPESKKFLQELKDENLENVYITAQQLDSKFRELRENERDLEAWLFQTLLGPILGTGSD